VTSSGSYALKDSTPIPESVTSIEITTSGEIMYDAEGQPVSAGYVGIVELSELNRLQTVDGVFFTSETLDASSVPGANAELTTYHLEMSNVNRTDDTQLLELLNTELP
jgi:flagellar basal body rod protein FlgG